MQAENFIFAEVLFSRDVPSVRGNLSGGAAAVNLILSAVRVLYDNLIKLSINFLSQLATKI